MKFKRRKYGLGVLKDVFIKVKTVTEIDIKFLSDLIDHTRPDSFIEDSDATTGLITLEGINLESRDGVDAEALAEGVVLALRDIHLAKADLAIWGLERKVARKPAVGIAGVLAGAAAAGDEGEDDERGQRVRLGQGQRGGEVCRVVDPLN